MPRKKGDCRKRIYAASLAFPLVVVPLYLGYISYLALFFLLGSFYEWSKISKVPAVFSFIFLSTLVLFVTNPTYINLSFSLAFFLILLWRYKLLFPLGSLYIFGGIYMLASIFNDNPLELLQVLSFVWCGDICAYFVGKTLKGPKLAPSISPGKTWSGLLGGIIIPVSLFSFLFNLFYQDLNKKIVLTLLLVSFAAHMGDLLESKIKRHFGVKDSGSILPGHGGFLDRLDSIFAVGWIVFLIKCFQ